MYMRMVFIYMVFIYFSHGILVLLSTLLLNKTGKVYGFKHGITVLHMWYSWYVSLFKPENTCTANAWTQAGNPGNFLIDCFDAASLLSGWEAEFIHVDLDCAVACSQNCLICSVASAQMHTLFWGIKEECYRKMHLFIEFCSSSAFAAKIESKQGKLKKKGQNSQLQEMRNPGKKTPTKY